MATNKSGISKLSAGIKGAFRIGQTVRILAQTGADWLMGERPPAPILLRQTFERLGIPEQERKFLAGVEAQFDSEAAYSNIKDIVAKQGVIFVNSTEGLREHPELGVEIVGFLGPNGAGKSTTMRILTGYLPATSGSVRICGLSVATQPDDIKRKIGYMPENNPLPDDLRVREYLHLRGRLKGLTRRKLAPRLDEVVHLCDLGECDLMDNRRDMA